MCPLGSARSTLAEQIQQYGFAADLLHHTSSERVTLLSRVTGACEAFMLTQCGSCRDRVGRVGKHGTTANRARALAHAAGCGRTCPHCCWWCVLMLVQSAGHAGPAVAGRRADRPADGRPGLRQFAVAAVRVDLRAGRVGLCGVVPVAEGVGATGGRCQQPRLCTPAGAAAGLAPGATARRCAVAADGRHLPAQRLRHRDAGAADPVAFHLCRCAGA